MLVRDIMHAHPVTIQQSAAIGEAARLLERLSVRHLPVLDGTRLVAMVSDRDFRSVLGEWTDEQARAEFAKQSLSTIVDTNPVTLSAAEDVVDAVDTMVDTRVGALPVVDDRQVLVGILSYVDVLRAVADNMD